MGTRGYLIVQGYSNLRKHSGKTFSTMLIICLTMILLGVFLIGYVNIDKNVKVITENQGLKAFISEDIDEKDVQAIADKIKQITNVKNITYLDKDAALADAKDTLKEYSYLLDGYEAFNPFPRSFIVVFESLESTEHVKEAIESVDGIYKVTYNEKIINAVITISEVGSIVVIALGIAMIAISIFIISNTIKLSVYSNKREIYIMKYIGATSKFIKCPFVVSGVLMGIGSALLSWVLVSLAYILLYSKLPQMNSEIGMFGFVPYSTFWYLILGAFVLIGVFLGGIGSSIAIRKYLKDFKPSKIVIKEEKKKVRKVYELEKEAERKAELAKKLEERDINWKREQEEKLKPIETKKEVKKSKGNLSELEEAKQLRRSARKNAKK
ncbi:MAG: permease-like cell division protein FtsX [Clostridia bacterium]|nr:permease-like cell division protein FtsX [Clostridia bacterium]